VIDSRVSEDGSAVRRRRECQSCGERWTTYERRDVPRLFVRKRGGKLQPFDREKLLDSLRKACNKRPVTERQLEEAGDRIERALRDGLDEEVGSSQIGELVMIELRDLDKVAYIRYASVYKDFREVDAFVEEIESLENGHPRVGETASEAGASASAPAALWSKQTTHSGEGL